MRYSSKKFQLRGKEDASEEPDPPKASPGKAAGSATAKPDVNVTAPANSSPTGGPKQPADKKAKQSKASDLSAREEIDAIKQENLSGRQLRTARHLALKHNLQATSDLDAVRLLRHAGLDPFDNVKKGGEVLELVAKGNKVQLATVPTAKVPAKRTPTGEAPRNEEQLRQAQIRKMQLALAKRRRRRFALLAARLFVFVALPSIIAGYYFYKIATPMYASYTEFVIQQSSPPGAGASGGMGSLLSGSPFATSQDAITVQSYLNSRIAMLRLNETLGFSEIFQRPELDSLQQLDPDASDEESYRLYRKHVLIGFDPTEGIVKMEVIAPKGEEAHKISLALIGFAEERVDQLTIRMREDQLSGSREAYQKAEAEMEAAQAEVLELQTQRGILSAESEISLQMSQISALETELLALKLELEERLDNLVPNKAKVDALKASIKRRETHLAEMRLQLTEGSEKTASLARISGELAAAQSRLLLRQEIVTQSLLSQEAARAEVSRQTRFLSMGVEPIVPDAPAYPKSLINTIVSALVFLGIYLMVSLTSSILREQMSA